MRLAVSKDLGCEHRTSREQVAQEFLGVAPAAFLVYTFSVAKLSRAPPSIGSPHSTRDADDPVMRSTGSLPLVPFMK